MDPVGREPARAADIGARVGRFQIVKLLGRGGMGEVYLADDPTLQRKVALKVISRHLVDDPERRAWFHREATSAAALNHPNICTIFEVGDDDGRAFIAMEAIEGRTLRAMIADGPLAPDRVIQIALQVAAALEHARERHVVHRDLKSANILITAKGAVKVLDFGLAKRVLPDAIGDGLTTEWASRADLQIGTLPYMSPEQALARPVDHRSDLFSLGVVLYECLTGAMPFKGPSAPELMDAILHREPPRLDAARSDVPAGLAAIVNRLLRKLPDDRYQTADELAADLQTLQETGIVRVQRPRTFSRRALAVASVAVVAAIAGVWWGVQRVRQSVSPAPTIVVVPATVTGSSQFQYLTDAIPASLTSRLASGGRLRMKMPPSSVEFAQIGGNLARVGDTYHVTACVVPRVTVTAGRLMLAVQIVDPASRDVLWSGEYQSGFDRYGEALAEAAEGVLASVTGTRRAPASQTAAPEGSALELAISRGRYHSQRFNAQGQRADFDAAETAFEEALRIDPRSSNAAAERAFLRIYAIQSGQPADRMLPELDSWARRAIDSDPENGLAWAVLVAGEQWRPQIDLPRLLDYGFRAASLGQTCGRCQFGVIGVAERFSLLLKYRAAQRWAELDPLYINALLNGAVSVSALGRTEDASTNLAQARAIDPDAVWLHVHDALIQGAAGATGPAARIVAQVTEQGRLKTLPAWIAPMLDAVSGVANGDRELVARSVSRLRDDIRQRRISGVAVFYANSLIAPMLARGGYADAALDIVIDAANADAPAPYDMLVMNPVMKRLMESPRASDVVVRSRAKFDVLLRAVDEARAAGRFPQYFEQPLEEIRRYAVRAGQP